MRPLVGFAGWRPGASRGALLLNSANPIRAGVSRRSLGRRQLNVSVLCKKPEVTYEIKVRLTNFKSHKPDNLGQGPLAVTPEQRQLRHSIPGARGKPFALIRRDVVQRNRPNAEPLYNDL